MGAKGSTIPGISPAWLLALLLLLAILPYANTLQNGFVYDDNNEVLTNPYIRSFAHVGDIFSTRILAHLGARGATNYYRPISIFGFLICYKLFGLLPYGFHLANLLLHALIVCVLFGLTQRLFQDQWLAFAAAAIFALHPIHTESVAWVSGVTDLDLAVFYLGTFWFFLASARPQGARSEWMQLGMVGSFILALLSKEQAVTLPLTAMIYEHFYRGDRATHHLAAESVALRRPVAAGGGLRLVSDSLFWRLCARAVDTQRELVRGHSFRRALGGPILVEDDLAGSPHRLLSLSQKRHAARPSGFGRSRGAGLVRAGFWGPLEAPSPRFLRFYLVLHQHCSRAEFPLAGPQRLHREVPLPSFRGPLLGGRLGDSGNLELERRLGPRISGAWHSEPS